MKDVIQEMVKREIEDIIGENRGSINEMVKKTLFPSLKALIRKEIHRALDELLDEEPEMSEKSVPAKTGSFQVPDQPENENHPSAMGLYLYCIADSGQDVKLGNVGIEGNEVYAMPFGELSAIVHDGTATPYHSDDQDKVKEWVLAHQKVVDDACKKFGTVIPMGFDTIIRGKGDEDPKETVRKWIETDYDNLASKMAKIRNRAEYGVQIFWKTKTMVEKISDESLEIKKMREEINTKPRGIAYMHRQKLEELLKNEMSKRADQFFQEFYEAIKIYAHDIRVEKTKKTDDEGLKMLLNVSCLLSGEQSEELGEALEEIDKRKGFSVRYTGPWPPYSFV